MNFILKTLTVLIIINITSVSQPVLEWARTYNGPMNQTDLANALAVDDSGYVYVTGVIGLSSTSGDYCTIKYKPNGDSLWVRIYGQPGNTYEVARDIITDSMGYVYVTGVPWTLKYDKNGNMIWATFNNSGSVKILKTINNNLITVGNLFNRYYVLTMLNTFNGDTLWRKYFDIGDGSVPYDMVIDKNNNLIVAGRKGDGPSPPNYYDFYVLKLDLSGDSIWSYLYNGPDPQVPYDFCHAVTVDDTGNIYATGFSDNEIGQSQFFTVKLTPDGDTVWTRRFSIGGSDAWNIDLDRQGNIYVSGRTNITKATVIKYSNDGTLLWSRILPGTMAIGDIPFQTLDSMGNIYITATSTSVVGIQLIKYDMSGNQLWYGSYTNAYPRDIKVRNNNVYICGSFGAVDFLTLKYSQPIGIKQISSQIPDEFRLYQNYPNPFNSSTVIRYQVVVNSLVTLKIYDLLGIEIAVLVNEELNPGTYEIIWNASNIATGVYFYRLISENFSETKKLILIK